MHDLRKKLNALALTALGRVNGQSAFVALVPSGDVEGAARAVNAPQAADLEAQE